MKPEKLKIRILIVLIMPFFFMTCNKDEKSSKTEVITDAYIIKKKIDGLEKSATAFYAYSNTGLASVMVTPPAGAGNPFELTVSQETSYSFFKEPANEDFQAGWPLEGNYQFDVVTAGGETFQQTDYLERVDLDMPVITSTSFDTRDITLTVKWETVTGADGILVKLRSNEGSDLFIGNILPPSYNEFVVGHATGIWQSSAYSGDELVLQIQAFAFESDVTLENNIYNIGTISISEKNITWGQ